jgi:hypothetical protein
VCANEKSETGDEPIRFDRAERLGVGDGIVPNIVDLELTRIANAQRHVGCAVSVEVAKPGTVVIVVLRLVHPHEVIGARLKFD